MTIRNAPKLAGPLENEEAARGEADRMNEGYGGPGFHVELFDREIGDKYVDGPYAYVAKEVDGQWYAVLTLMPELR